MLASLLVLLATDATAASPKGLEGTWELTDLGGRLDEIERLVGEMGFWTRIVARSRLKGATEPCAEVRIWTEGERVGLGCDDKPVVVGRPDGRPFDWSDGDGQTYQVSLELREGALVQTFVAEEGTRTNTYAPGGGTLRLDVVVTAEQLPRPLVYSELYAPSGPEVAAQP